ncbi:fibronectin type III domain-containing protein [Pseudodesulfovibrio portus]|uniref:Fibronectin type-III domain-containing protein n=1 Tax=Pseudodesulfovibrio portus TaxID=231439 RepID=A0ABN6RYD0_9BACT|nr:fibronectin type III domain-containing protein [Pseudodesulfovibrio portus]BDQ34446.1 hypothetical protein JCM14722_19880 [Pseudodesulfovibrio portus]
MTLEDILERVKNSNTQVVKYGYAVYVLFSIAVAVLSWAKGASLGRLFFVVILLMGLAGSAWAFQQMTTAKTVFWRYLGFVFGGCSLLCILFIFVVSSYFLVTGKPDSLRHLLGIDPPTVVSITNLRLESKGKEFITLSWDAYAGKAEEILLKHKRCDLHKFQEIILPTDAVQFSLPSVEPNKKYRFILYARSGELLSNPAQLIVSTDADKKYLGKEAEYEIFYTGRIDANDRANDDNGLLYYRCDADLWVYEGKVVDGNPSGKGRLTQRIDCGISFCETSFSSPGQFSGYCRLALRDPRIDFVGDSEQYFGCIEINGNVLTKSTPSRPNANLRVGPFTVVLDGEVDIDAGNSKRIEGVVTAGKFSGVITQKTDNYESIYRYLDGEKQLGYYINLGHTLGVVGSTYEPGSDHDIKLLFNGTTVRYGLFRGSTMPYTGYNFAWNLVSGRMWATSSRNGNDTDLSPVGGMSGLCANEEHFGLAENGANPNEVGSWKLDCGSIYHDDQKVGIECTLESEMAQVSIVATKMIDSYPEFIISTGGHASNLMSIDIDGQTFSGPSLNYAIKKAAPLALARMAFASQITNTTQGLSTSLDGVDKLIAILFGRLYYCTGPYYMDD